MADEEPIQTLEPSLARQQTDRMNRHRKLAADIFIPLSSQRLESGRVVHIHQDSGIHPHGKSSSWGRLDPRSWSSIQIQLRRAEEGPIIYCSASQHAPSTAIDMWDTATYSL